MGFVESIKTCFSKYFVFSGRATRSEYWYFNLFYILGSIIAKGADIAADIAPGDSHSIVELIFIFAIISPFLSVAIRRLHDVNRSGWWWLIPLTIIGLIPYFYWMVKPSDTSTNKYGPKPAK